MKLFFKILLFALFVLLPSLPYAANNKAVLVGISQYEDSEINCLAYADEDVKSFGSILFNIANYDRSDVTILLNSKARKTAIMNVVVDLVKKSQKEPIDSLIFMFAGHGIPDNIYSHNTNSFLAPYDAMVSQFFHEGSSGTISNETFINRAWLVKQLSDVRAASVVIILDSCYSGAKDFGELFAKNMGFAVSYGKLSTGGGERGLTVINKTGNVITEKKIAFIASSKGNQVSTEYKELQHGALSYCIFQHINNTRKATHSNDAVDITVGSLYSNIETLFDNVQVRGASLSSIHQPILFPIPSYDDVSQMKFFSVRGIKPQEPEPVYIASPVLKPEPLPSSPPKQEESKLIAKAPPQVTPATFVEPPKTEKVDKPGKPAKPATPKPEPQKEAVADVPVSMPKQPESKPDTAKIITVSAELPKPKIEPPKMAVADLLVAKPKQPEPKPGTVEITTEPGNAEIYVNGEKTGQNSNSILTLNAGNHLISLYINETNYKHTINVNVKDDTHQKIIVQLRGSIGVEAYSGVEGKEVPVLDVYLDGRYIGNTGSKLEINDVVSGTHKLKVKTGNVVKERQVEIRHNSPLLVRYKIIKEATSQTSTPEDGVSSVTF